MKKITDEILNDYIDNQLSIQDVDTINNEIKSDPELLERLKALQATHRYLNSLEQDTAPSGIRSKVMAQIFTSSPEKKKHTFFSFILSIFGIAIIGVTAISISNLSKTETTGEQFESVKNFIIEKASSGVSFFESLSTSQNLIMIGASLSVLLLFGLYYIINSHKMFREQLKSFGQ